VLAFPLASDLLESPVSVDVYASCEDQPSPVLEYIMNPTPGPPPFVLPEYTVALVRFVHDGVLRLMEAKDPVWGMIPRAEPWEAVPTTQNTMPSGQVVQNSPVMAEAKFVLRYDDIRSSCADALAEQMDAAAS